MRKKQRRKLSIREQIFWSLIIVSVCSALILGTIVYSVASRIIAQNYHNTYTENLEVSSKITDIQLGGIIEIMRSQLSDREIMETLKNSNQQENGNKFFPVEKSLSLRSRLSAAMGRSQFIEGVTIISLSGEAIIYYKTEATGGIYERYQNSDILGDSWVEQVESRQGREVFFSTDVIADELGDFFTIGKQLNDTTSKQPVGYMLVSVRNSLFKESFAKQKSGQMENYNMVIDSSSENPVVFFAGDNSFSEEILESYLNNSAAISDNVFSAARNQTTGWQLVNAISRSDLNKDARMIATIVGFTFMVLIVLSALISSSISHRIERPLKQLEELIEQTGEGKREFSESFDDSEIGLIGTKFQTLISDNLVLNEKLLSLEIRKRESELLLLQSQINPHFLYNTLDSLYCMAIIANNDEIAEMVSALANIFRLSLSEGRNIITIQDEINHIQEYMFIQNIRYNQRFRLNINIPPEVLGKNMLKLVLQPLVENAVYHGLEPKLGQGTISLAGNLEGDDIVFVVEDDGVGMADISVTKTGYGLSNVSERIALYYGKEYGITFESSVGKGTKAVVKIGKNVKEENQKNEEANSNR